MTLGKGGGERKTGRTGAEGEGKPGREGICSLNYTQLRPCEADDVFVLHSGFAEDEPRVVFTVPGSLHIAIDALAYQCVFGSQILSCCAVKSRDLQKTTSRRSHVDVSFSKKTFRIA